MLSKNNLKNYIYYYQNRK